MSKWYEVTVVKTIVYAVEVKENEGQEQAEYYALDACSMDGNNEVESVRVQESDVDSVKRHADEVLTVDD